MKTIFICLDTVRRDYLSFYGNDWVKTPNLDRLAAKSVIFDSHWVGSLPCMPARREFMTGRHNFLHRRWGPIEPFDDTMPQELRKKKVFSHLLTDHYHYLELGGLNYHCFFNTWDFYRGQEGDPWASFVDGPELPKDSMNARMSRQHWYNRQRQVKEEDFSASQTSVAAAHWLDDNHAADGWFLQVEIFDPHEPFYCTEKYREMYNDTWDGPLFDWPSYDVVKESPEAVDHIRKCYAGLLTMTDHWLGRIFDKMDEYDLWKDTLVVFTTDHGTMLGEHKYWMKNFMPVYNEIARIPLVVHLPGGDRAGTRIGDVTQSIDIMPTVLDHHGVDPPPHVYGKSLIQTAQGTKPREDGIFGYFGKAVNLTDGQRVYFRNPIHEHGGPLHQYTAMPPAIWHRDRPKVDQVEMGRYFGHTYNIPIWKIQSDGAAPHHHEDEASRVNRHELFDLGADAVQETPLDDAKLEAHYAERIAAHLAACEAPAEQFVRLGLEPEK